MGDCGHMRFTGDTPLLHELGLGAAALRYASLGYSVLPLDRGGKRPHRMLGREGGVHWASRDPRRIRAWWQEDKAANIGVATGRDSQLLVIDLDVKGEHDGREVLARFLLRNAEELRLPRGFPVQFTPSGGQHLWLHWPWDYPVPERPSILAGVDVKGDGGYVLAAPSMLLMGVRPEPGGNSAPVPVPYRWQGCPCERTACPPWLAEWAHTAPRAPRPGGSPDDAGIDAEKVMAEGAPAGQRNITYYRLACQRYRLHGTRGEGAAAAQADVVRAWQAGDRTGMPYTEIMIICESARRFIEQAVRQDERNHAEMLRRNYGKFLSLKERRCSGGTGTRCTRLRSAPARAASPRRSAWSRPRRCCSGARRSTGRTARSARSFPAPGTCTTWAGCRPGGRRRSPATTCPP